MVLVELVSPNSGKVKLESTDPLYSAFFNSLEEIGGVIPNRLDVPDYITAQYSAWVRLLDWIELTPSVFYPGNGFYNGVKGADELRAKAPEPVYLAEVYAFIGYIATPPEGWLRFVAVDERTPQVDRLRHYQTVGRIVRGDETMEIHHTSGLWYDRLYKDFQIEEDPIRRRGQPYGVDINQAARTPISEEEYERLINIDWLNTLQGVRHNALVLSIGTNNRFSLVQNGDLDWRLILWQDVLTVKHNWLQKPEVERVGNQYVQKQTTKAGGTPMLCYALAGERVPRKPKYFVPHKAYMELPSMPGTISFTMRSSKAESRAPISFEVSSFGELYNRTLRAITLEEGYSVYNSVELGLSVLLTGGKYRDLNRMYEGDVIPKERSPTHTMSNTIYSIIPLLHVTVLLQVPRNRLKTTEGYNNITLDEKDFAETVNLVVSTLGRTALHLMVETLLHYNEDDAKAIAFCTAAGSVLDDDLEGPFIKLPD